MAKKSLATTLEEAMGLLSNQKKLTPKGKVQAIVATIIKALDKKSRQAAADAVLIRIAHDFKANDYKALVSEIEEIMNRK